MLSEIFTPDYIITCILAILKGAFLPVVVIWEYACAHPIVSFAVLGAILILSFISAFRKWVHSVS